MISLLNMFSSVFEQFILSIISWLFFIDLIIISHFDGISAHTIWAWVSLTTPGLVTETFSSIFYENPPGSHFMDMHCISMFSGPKNH